MKVHQTTVDPISVTTRTTDLESMMNARLGEVDASHAKRISETNPFMDTMMMLFFIVAIVSCISFARSLRTRKT